MFIEECVKIVGQSLLSKKLIKFRNEKADSVGI